MKDEEEMERSRRGPKPYNEYPLRICRTLHECNICRKPIMCGEYYYDGGYSRRVHKDCYDKLHNPMWVQPLYDDLAIS